MLNLVRAINALPDWMRDRFKAADAWGKLDPHAKAGNIRMIPINPTETLVMIGDDERWVMRGSRTRRALFDDTGDLIGTMYYGEADAHWHVFYGMCGYTGSSPDILIALDGLAIAHFG